ncbi:hypothetical protein BH10BDE1_BH10BDE1_32510 [soil metagenome]
MMRDRIIAIGERIPREVSIPIELGALRRSDSRSTWKNEAKSALTAGERVVLSGDISNVDDLVATISEILDEYPSARFGLLIHANQARSLQPSKNTLTFFETIYVATDERIEPPTIREIEKWWHPTWLLVPIEELNRGDWIPKFLLPTRQGNLCLFSPGRSSIPPDELRLQLERFQFDHPLIKISPPSHEWFVPAELGPSRKSARDAGRAKIVQDSRTRADYAISVVIPFLWTKERSESEMLARTLKSVAEAFASHESCEIIVAVDRISEGEALTAIDLELDLAETAFVDIERFDDASDWRAGFIRNCGSRFARNRDGFFLFIDADVSINPASPFSQQLRNLIGEDSFDLLQASDSIDQPAFALASSSLLVIRTSLFKALGGFCDAFSHYGCEDNFLIWSASQSGARIQLIPAATIQHFRPRRDSDDLVVKMLRLRESADLMYRMTLDPAVHQHFFSTLGSNLWQRAALKRIASHPASRWLIAPFVFVLTLIETQDRRKYLASFVETFVWKLKHPFLWVRSNSWKAQLVKHKWRQNAWKVPNFVVSSFGRCKVSLQRKIITVRASRFGWNFIGWRVDLWWNILKDQIRWRSNVTRIRFAGVSLWLLTAIVSLFTNLNWVISVGAQRTYGAILRFLGQLHAASVGLFHAVIARLRRVVSIYGNMKWKMRVASQRLFGSLRASTAGKPTQFAGEIRRIFVVYILVPATFMATRPQAIWSQHAWKISKLILELQAEFWLFKEPSGWFKLRTPVFYKWVWRPIIKVWRFFEYHLLKRWGNS